MPSRRHRSLTVTSRRKSSRTMRIFSSGMYLRRVAALTRRTKDLASSVRSSAASVLSVSDWDTSAPFMRYSTLTLGAHTTLRLSGFRPLQCVPFSLTVYSSSWPAHGPLEEDPHHQRYRTGLPRGTSQDQAYELLRQPRQGGPDHLWRHQPLEHVLGEETPQ